MQPEPHLQEAPQQPLLGLEVVEDVDDIVTVEFFPHMLTFRYIRLRFMGIDYFYKVDKMNLDNLRRAPN